jgi:uncharacterized protein
MQIGVTNDVILDSRRAVWLPKAKTLAVADFFIGLGAARRRRVDAMPSLSQQDLWERLFGLMAEYQPETFVIMGDLKPNQGTLEGEEAEELRQILKKLSSGGRQLVQVVGHPDRSLGPAMEGTQLKIVETHRAGAHTLMHRRRIFVYPRHESGQGFWINGGVHPLFAVPSLSPSGSPDWIRLPAFLHTGFALVMPPFVPYAQGYEVMQPERLPRQAQAWKLFAERISPLDLPSLPTPPEHLRNIARPPKRGKEGSVNVEA